MNVFRMTFGCFGIAMTLLSAYATARAGKGVERRTSNTEHRTSNIEMSSDANFGVRCSVFGVQCSAFQAAQPDNPTPIPAGNARPTLIAEVPVAVPVRFETVDVYIDAGDKPLAAYQFTLHSATKTALLAGLEGGEHPAFAQPPYYDPRALIDERVIVAAYSTAEELPQGRTRVARLHVQVTGDKNAEYVATLQTAAGADGSIIPAKLTVETAVR